MRKQLGSEPGPLAGPFRTRRHKIIAAIGFFVVGLAIWAIYLGVVGRTYSGSVVAVESLPILSDDLRGLRSDGPVRYRVHSDMRGELILACGSCPELAMRQFVEIRQLEGSKDTGPPTSLDALLQDGGASTEVFGLKCDRCYECYWLHSDHREIVRIELWYCPKTERWVACAFRANGR